MDWDGFKYSNYWNQVTPENGTKWGTVQGGGKNSFSWNGADNAYSYAQQHGFPFKFHCLVWGSQYPDWVKNISSQERYEAIVKWMDAVQNKYPNLEIIDVVNEAMNGHQSDTYLMSEALGGAGKTGYDWIIKSFELAHERWPNAILIYNDYNVLQWGVQEFTGLVRSLRNAGAPIDAYGCQAHHFTLNECSKSNLQNSLKTLQDALKMPMYITEYDINFADDAPQETKFKEQIPLFWEADYCAGVTLWGWFFGQTWADNTGLIRNKKERSALKWLREYMKTEKAQKAKSPFKNMRKEASIYIKPADFKVAKGDVVPVKVRVRMETEKVEKVELFAGTSVNNATTLVASMTEAPYICDFSATSTAGDKVLKAVVTTSDTTYVRYGGLTVLSSSTKRETYNEKPFEIPGVINVAEYDKGLSGVSYVNASRTPEKTATKDGAWMEYTVDVKEDGYYKVEAEVASVKSGGTFHLTEYGLDSLTFLANMIEVPVTGSATEFTTVTTTFKNPISAGQHRICLNVDKGGFFIKKLTFTPYRQNKNIKVTLSSVSPASITVGSSTTVKLTASLANSAIDSVVVYANGAPIATLTEAPYSVVFEPKEKGSYVITAVAWSGGYENGTTTSKTLKVNGKREPYAAVVELPGIIEAENFDKGGEGLSFHDSDGDDQGATNYRTDNEGVDIVTGNGGHALGYTAANEWLEYSVNVAKAGKFTCVATVSAGGTGSKFTISRKALNATGSGNTLWTVDVPKTGENTWSNYTEVELTTPKSFPAGTQYIRITITGANCNIDKLEFKAVEGTGIDDVQNDLTTPWGTSYNLSGQKVGDGYRGIVIRNGQKTLRR